MLAELREAHAALLGGIQDLEEATRAAVPDPSALAAIRWRLSRASGRRRRLVDQACAELRPSAPTEIERLREKSADLLSASSRHVGTWTIEQVLADWDGYRAASTAMRATMRKRILEEKAVLYPLLGKAS
jgi:hypothetical protein